MRVVSGIGRERLSNELEGIPREAIRNNQDSMVWKLGIKEINGKPDKVVPVSCDETSAFPGCVLKLFPVRPTSGSDIVCADRICFTCPDKLGYRGAQVLIKVKFQGRFTASEGC